MVKRHLILRKRPVPVQVDLPNGRPFTSRWERISRRQLPINIRVARDRKIGPRKNNRMICFNMVRPALKKIKKRRNQAVMDRLRPVYDRAAQRERAALDKLGPIYDRINQSGSGIGSDLLRTGLNLGSRAIGSDIGKKIINKGIDNIPNIFKFGRSKVRNQRIKNALESEIADLVVDEAVNKARKIYDSNDLI